MTTELDHLAPQGYDPGYDPAEDWLDAALSDFEQSTEPFDGYGATRETRGTSQNVKRPRTVATAGGMTGSPMEAPDV